MKLIIDLPNKTIAHIRSDYGHKYFGCIGDDDKKIIMKAIYDGTPLEEELEKIREEIMNKGMIPTHTYITPDGKALQKSVVDVVIDNHIKELKGENNEQKEK